MNQIWCRDFASPTYHSVSTNWVYGGRAQCGEQLAKPVFTRSVNTPNTIWEYQSCDTCLQIVTEQRKEIERWPRNITVG